MAFIEELDKQGNFLFKHRSYFPLLFLLVTIAVFYFEVIQSNSYLSSINYWYFALAIGLLGLMVRVFTVGFTPINTSGRNTSEGQVADELNQTGIYSVVRHPLYVGNYLMWLAVAMLTASLWFIISFTLVYWVYYERIMFAEEAFLRNKFGEKYLGWAANVPAFIPMLSIPTKPKYPLSVKKILKKEKNGVAALFGLFWLFDALKNYLESGQLNLQKNFWFWAFAISAVVYLILKIIKRSTTILEDGR
ncbi:MAG: protein-S-isoprenylcysteine O-methyltransferase Ste14 [Arcticibacterium sp.]|jgi:protein-S-isoprenylcysteine O-methyltransferase Ste14